MKIKEVNFEGKLSIREFETDDDRNCRVFWVDLYDYQTNNRLSQKLALYGDNRFEPFRSNSLKMLFERFFKSMIENKMIKGFGDGNEGH